MGRHRFQFTNNRAKSKIIRWQHDQMHMFRHEHISKYFDIMFFQYQLETFQKQRL